VIFVFQRFSNRSSAPLFGAIKSRIAIEASLRKSSHQNSILVKPFNQAPKEIPISIKPAVPSSGQGVRELQSELAKSEILHHWPSSANAAHESETKDHRPTNSNAALEFETPRRNLQRQAYVAMKASPNVSADGDVRPRVCMPAFPN
jgi:hypothetical protein